MSFSFWKNSKRLVIKSGESLNYIFQTQYKFEKLKEKSLNTLNEEYWIKKKYNFLKNKISICFSIDWLTCSRRHSTPLHLFASSMKFPRKWMEHVHDPLAILLGSPASFSRNGIYRSHWSVTLTKQISKSWSKKNRLEIMVLRIHSAGCFSLESQTLAS